MSTRKRQRPSARDFFDHPPTITTPIQVSPIQSHLHELQPTLITQARLQEYCSALLAFEPFDQILELIRGKDQTDSIDASSNDAVIFILKSKESYTQFPDPINRILKPSHIARILWGPGRKEVAHAKTIYLGPLQVSVEKTRVLTTELVYAIQFSDQRSADIATQVIEFKLNQFFIAEGQNFLVQVKNGSNRWFIQDQAKSMDQSDWKIEKTKIPFLRPLPSLKSHSTENYKRTDQLNESSSFELFQLPKMITIPILVKNLLKLHLLEFPIQIKLTEETTTDLPIRILLKFSNTLSAKICKISLFHRGLFSNPDEAESEAKRLQFIIDEGDSSIKDVWNIWKSALVWEQESIIDFIKSQQPVKLEEEQQEDEEKVDQLGDIKPDGFGSDEFDEWASNNPTETREAGGTNIARAVPRTLSYQQTLVQNEKEWERELEKLTLLADTEYITNQANLNKCKISNPNSGFYQVSQKVLEDKQFQKLTNLIETRSRRKKLAKEYRKIKPLSKKIKRQRKAWRSGQQEPNENDGDDSEEEDEEEEGSNDSESDELNERQRALLNEEQWKRFRHKKRSKRLLQPISSSEDDDDDQLVSKSLLTHDNVYQHIFARPNEPLPGEIS